MKILILSLIISACILNQAQSLGVGCYQLVQTQAFFQFSEENITLPFNSDNITLSPCQFVYQINNVNAYGSLSQATDNSLIPITNGQNPKYSLIDSDNPNNGLSIIFGQGPNQAQLSLIIYCDKNIELPLFNYTITPVNNNVSFNISGYSNQACYKVAFPSIFQVLNNNKDWLTVGLILMGIFLLFFGWYSDKVIVFLATFLLVFIILIVFLSNVAITATSPSWVSWISLVGSTIAGLIAAFILVFKYKNFGHFVVGLLAGLLVGILMYALVLHYINFDGMLYISMAFFAILLGYLMVKQRELVEIWITAFIGAYLLIRSLGIYIGDYPNEFMLYQQLQADNYTFPWLTYIYFLGIIVLCGIGVYFQKQQYKNKKKKSKSNRKNNKTTKNDLLIDDEEE